MQVDGINMHFVHHKSELPNARPILLIHGWPGSFIEFHAIIPKLTAAGYDVVAPSLPGYAFSSPPTRWISWATRVYCLCAVTAGSCLGAVSWQLHKQAVKAAAFNDLRPSCMR